MKRKEAWERCCALCEYSQEIFEGEYCICKKKGVVSPGGVCRKFQFDPLKVKVSVRKIPRFSPIPE